MIESDKIFAMSARWFADRARRAGHSVRCGVLQLFPLTAAEFTFKFDPAKPQERLKFNNLLPMSRAPAPRSNT